MREHPISPDEFSMAMQVAEPLESNPHLAVAVSGGADSMALAVLCHEWAVSRNGHVTAIIVDHGLRQASSEEARLTADRLSQLGIPAEILPWIGDKPATGVQARARSARYDIMNQWCRSKGVLHLLVAHHADDQAETFLMRIKRGSGPDGLAAMASVRALSACQIIRPLLGFPKSRLIATLGNLGIGWIEDPSNVDPKYARTGIRRTLSKSDDDEALSLLQGAKRFERARHALEAQVSEWLARHAVLHAEGYLEFDAQNMFAVHSEIRLRILSRAARVIGGKTYPPAITAVERLQKKMSSGAGATLGGARFVISGNAMMVCREARNLPDEMPLPHQRTLWDDRFLIFASNENSGFSVRPWTPEMAKRMPRKERPAWFQAIPDCARNGYPVVNSGCSFELVKPGCIGNKEIFVQFAPKIPLSGGGFSVA